MSLHFSEKLKENLLSINLDKQIVIYDDAKEKPNSFEAYATKSKHVVNVICDGYGSTEDVALNELRCNLVDHITELEDSIKELREFISMIDNKQNITKI